MDDELKRIRDLKIEKAIASRQQNGGLSANYNRLLQNPNPGRQILPVQNPAFTPRADDVGLIVQPPPVQVNIRLSLLAAPTDHLYKILGIVQEILASRPDAKR
jgi:hypothetical protein